MWPVTQAFLDEVRHSHSISVAATVATPDTTPLASLSPTSGSVGVDSRRAARRDLTMTVVDPTGALTPTGAADVLSPLTGNEIAVSRGVRYASGAVEPCPLGVFVILKATVADSDQGLTVQLYGRDRSARVTRNRWTEPYAVTYGQPLEAEVERLLRNRLPWVQVDFPATGFTTPRGIVYGLETSNDPWLDAQALAASAGFDLHFRQDGVATMALPVDPYAATAVVDYSEGSEAVLTAIDREWDAETGYNGVIVTGEGSDVAAPIRAEAWDDDPTSPTYVGGPYGRVPMFYSSPLITSLSQGRAVARSMLAQMRGAAESLTWRQVVNPAHDAGDAVSVTRARLGLSQTCVLDAFTVPLTAADAMSATVRTAAAGATS